MLLAFEEGSIEHILWGKSDFDNIFSKVLIQFLLAVSISCTFLTA